MPFPLLGLDTDNDSVFMNETIRDYCVREGIVFTRCRPYRKNDQAHVEQKNGAIVRRIVGYRRFEGLAATRELGHLYAATRLFVNAFQPSFKLAEKERDGAIVRKLPCSRNAMRPTFDRCALEQSCTGPGRYVPCRTGSGRDPRRNPSGSTGSR